MLPSANRLKSDAEFGEVFKKGKSAEGRFIKIKFFLAKKGPSRFGFVVGAKFAKSAVRRNLIKRRLRAAARLLLQEIKSGFDIVVWPKREALRAKPAELAEDFKKLLIKNDLLFI